MHDDDDDDLLDDLLDQWEAARERGRPLDASTLCRERPSLQPQLAQRIAALEAMECRLAGDASAADDASSLALTTQISDLKFHAAGGLGAVYAGEDRAVHRKVAVKFLHAQLAHDPPARERFLLEAEVTGRLEHPGVIPLYGVGEDAEGRLFYAMRFLDGVTLEAAIRQAFAGDGPSADAHRVEHRRLLQSFVSVCKTMAYAHNRGIVHRDLKPENILLGRYGETIVVDWGLATPVLRDELFRQSGERTLLLRSGSSAGASSLGAGTPAYMSPEQASELAPTPSSDIYNLGATLFKLATGVAPAQGATLQEIRTKIIEGRLPRASQVRSDVSRALEAICGKAMALRPADRYATALELAEDVERYLADEPISAMVEPLSSRAARFARRHRLAAQIALVGLTACLLVAGASAIWLTRLVRTTETARAEAETAQREAEVARRGNLRASALYLAKSLAQEIDLRWRLLESETASSRLRDSVAQANARLQAGEPLDADLQRSLQTWIEKRFIANHDAVRTTSWILNAVEGTQLARAPEADSIGKNYAHRDYFHGQGRDLPPSSPEAQGLSPLAQKIVHMSAVYESVNTGTLMVAFAVPVWDGPAEQLDRRRIGVLSMCVELGAFALGANTLLVDARVDQLENLPGLVLHHSQLGARRSDEPLPRLSPSVLEEGLALRHDRRQGQTLRDAARSNLIEALPDPLNGEPHLAAIEPVIVRGRPAEIADTGWLVIVTEQVESE